VTRSRTITAWDPEDRLAWEVGGKAIARRNLIWSVVAEHVGFSVWSLWSVMVLFMPQNVFGLTAGEKFLVAATATLVGAALRLPYTMATAPLKPQFIEGQTPDAVTRITTQPGQPSRVSYGSEKTTQSCRKPSADPGVSGSALRCSSARVGTTRSRAVS
jgi:hypothetical protein